jgi:hypothetical protein
VLTRDDFSQVALEETDHGPLSAAIFSASAALSDLGSLNVLAHYYASTGQEPLLALPADEQEDICENVIEHSINLAATTCRLQAYLRDPNVSEVLTKANDYPATMLYRQDLSHTAATAKLAVDALTWLKIIFKIPHDERLLDSLRGCTGDVYKTAAALDKLAEYGRFELELAHLHLVKERQRSAKISQGNPLAGEESDIRLTGAPEAPLSDDAGKVLDCLAQIVCGWVAGMDGAVSQQKIGDRIGRDRRTVSKALTELRKRGFAGIPQGKARGNAITDAGLEYLRTLGRID